MFDHVPLSASRLEVQIDLIADRLVGARLVIPGEWHSHGLSVARPSYRQPAEDGSSGGRVFVGSSPSVAWTAEQAAVDEQLAARAVAGRVRGEEHDRTADLTGPAPPGDRQRLGDRLVRIEVGHELGGHR